MQQQQQQPQQEEQVASSSSSGGGAGGSNGPGDMRSATDVIRRLGASSMSKELLQVRTYYNT
ncbi:unnamed protein product [Gongylonema pulchrum]|uniref:Uncharacterized protein n=1 Tax=Gongylonema pulchrum TaxID=637853 RepID=A0A183F0H3_9BILA|nr:unnamed protein product [Gongylonema pulchrum]